MTPRPATKRAAVESPGRTPAREPDPSLAPVGGGSGTPSSSSPLPDPGTAAKTPDPVTGAAPDGRAAPGRGRATVVPAGGESPAGRAGGTGSSSAGSRITAGPFLADPKAQYAAARAKALAAQARKRPADPQQVPRRADPRAAVAEMMQPCTCTHPALNHWQTESGRVTWCSIATATGPCGCELYQRAPGGAA
jgi:hypothetical protein